MRIFGKDVDREVVVVAEIGVNHEGSLDAAIRLMRLAREAGADAAKFQTFTPERYASSSDMARLKRVTGFDLGREGFRKLADEAAKLDFPIFSTAVSEDVIPFLDEMFPAIKIASGDIDFEPAIRAAAATGKPVFLSTGLATMDEVATAVGWFRDAAGTKDIRDRLILMHCVTAYPAPVEQANVQAVPYLAAKTGLRVGYSNHVIGLEACLGAVALGACALEVHFTDRKTGREFRDHQLSCDPDDMRRLLAMIGPLKASLGTAGKQRQPAEVDNLKVVRKGVVAARDMAAGTTLSRGDLMFARPATEIPAGEIESLPGARLKAAVRKGELITRANLDRK
jgi:N-acetylneuraminate synthase/N,N'-diacetyllegionaminate synthase